MTGQAKMTRGAESVALFLAHALQLESDAVERYSELTGAMEAHNQPDVARLFREMSGYAVMHRDEIRAIAGTGGGLPRLQPWEFDWGGGAESPESADWEATHYLMSPAHALRLALDCERMANRYYAGVAAVTKDAEVARLAAEFAEEEACHAALLEKWAEKHPLPAAGWDDDPDPPNVSD
jgi:rubrerythrin